MHQNVEVNQRIFFARIGKLTQENRNNVLVDVHRGIIAQKNNYGTTCLFVNGKEYQCNKKEREEQMGQ